METGRIPDNLPPASDQSLVKEGVYSAPCTSAQNAERHRRTPGLKILDVFLYPFLTNIAVFGISVGATYLTARGGDKNASGKLIFGKVGQWFQNRGERMIKRFKSIGMSEGQADMSKMVFFSFLDGSAMAPVVKLFEDRREKIGRWIDDRLGTAPADDSAYEAEPKQTWRSVLGGRLATCMIVVPTAVALDKMGWNDKLFNNPGKKMGAVLAAKPKIAKFFEKMHLDVKELSRISFFEAFYTSVCTGGLYFSSRFLGRCIDNNAKKHSAKAAAVTVSDTASSEGKVPTDVITGTQENRVRKPTENMTRRVPVDRLPGRFSERHGAIGAEQLSYVGI